MNYGRCGCAVAKAERGEVNDEFGSVFGRILIHTTVTSEPPKILYGYR